MPFALHLPIQFTEKERNKKVGKYSSLRLHLYIRFEHFLVYERYPALVTEIYIVNVKSVYSLKLGQIKIIVEKKSQNMFL